VDLEHRCLVLPGTRSRYPTGGWDHLLEIDGRIPSPGLLLIHVSDSPIKVGRV